MADARRNTDVPPLRGRLGAGGAAAAGLLAAEEPLAARLAALAKKQAGARHGQTAHGVPSFRVVVSQVQMESGSMRAQWAA